MGRLLLAAAVRCGFASQASCRRRRAGVRRVRLGGEVCGRMQRLLQARQHRAQCSPVSPEVAAVALGDLRCWSPPSASPSPVCGRCSSMGSCPSSSPSPKSIDSRLRYMGSSIPAAGSQGCFTMMLDSA